MEPIQISLVAGRYLLFDINVVTYLRRTYNICGVLIGGIPQVPQQNVFNGLPVELLPEEAKILVEKEVAYIVDDVAWHTQRYNTIKDSDRQQYLDKMKTEGEEAQAVAEESARKRTATAIARHAMLNAGSRKPADDARPESSKVEGTLFEDERPASRASNSSASARGPWAVTPSTSGALQSSSRSETQQSSPPVPSSYPLFKHLHSQNYFLTPGLRFGCNYTVYPGDPLRFHSHFLATGYGWNEEIPLLDLVGGGRLGTGVKKGFLIGGENVEADGGEVRTFCIEWGGM